MAIALEELSPEAAGAVSAAAAGHGSKLTAGVKKELEGHAARKAASTGNGSAAPSLSVAVPGAGAVRYAGGALKKATQTGSDAAVATFKGATGAPTPLIRILLAFGAGLLALELASYVSGRYFTWNLATGSQKLQTATTHLGLYPGQTEKLSAQAAVYNGTHALG
jgi:hypothetical protein